MKTAKRTSRLPEILSKHEDDILAQWLDEQKSSIRSDLISMANLTEDSREFLQATTRALQSGGLDIDAPAWAGVREHLDSVSRSRARQGFSPSETATFVFSLKRPLFAQIRSEASLDADSLAEEMWTATALLDNLGLYTIEVAISWNSGDSIKSVAVRSLRTLRQ